MVLVTLMATSQPYSNNLNPYTGEDRYPICRDSNLSVFILRSASKIFTSQLFWLLRIVGKRKITTSGNEDFCMLSVHVLSLVANEVFNSTEWQQDVMVMLRRVRQGCGWLMNLVLAPPPSAVENGTMWNLTGGNMLIMWRAVHSGMPFALIHSSQF